MKTWIILSSCFGSLTVWGGLLYGLHLLTGWNGILWNLLILGGGIVAGTVGGDIHSYFQKLERQAYQEGKRDAALELHHAAEAELWDEASIQQRIKAHEAGKPPHENDGLIASWN